jgi:hypothetical protein
MKAIAYSIKSYEKESLILANGKKHALTMVSNALDEETIAYAEGKDVVMLTSTDVLDSDLLDQLSSFGVRYLIVRCADRNKKIDLAQLAANGFVFAQVSCDVQEVNARSRKIIAFLDEWHATGGAKCTGQCACQSCPSQNVEHFPQEKTCTGKKIDSMTI